MITTVFAATTPENMPFAYRASTSTNPNPMISHAFVEANYEVLESFLRERRRQIRNKDLRTELEYFSEDYDEEREMEPRPEPNREATPTFRPRPRLVIPYWGNLHLSSTRGYMPQIFANNGVPSYNGSMYPVVAPSSNYPFYTQPMYAPPNMPMYRNPTGSFIDSTGFVTSFVRWIEDYPLPDGLKMPSHIGSYDGKGDPDNFLHLFEGAICMQKWLMPIASHMFTYTLKDSACIWWNSQKTGLYEEQCISGFVHGLRTGSLVEHLSTDLSTTYKGLMEKTYTGLKQEKWKQIELLMIEGKILKDQGNPLRTITEDQTMDCSPTCLKAQERSLP
ncbi:hypothetical protein Tco_0394398 [Tanacetum coccineum]